MGMDGVTAFQFAAAFYCAILAFDTNLGLVRVFVGACAALCLFLALLGRPL